MEYRTKRENLEEKKWKSGYGKYVIGYGRGKVGRNNGKKEIVPIIKKGEGQEMKDYRGITIMPSMYKIYTAILAERVRKEVEAKNIIPDNQTGFRKGMGTIDQIYALNYLINRQLVKEKGKMTVLFIDLKAAFDSVNKERLINESGEE